MNFPEPRMMTGSELKATGGLSEKRVINYTARYFNIPAEEVLLSPLTPDASTRKYYRVAKSAEPDATCIISLYATPYNPQDNSFLDVTRLFEHVGLPVPRVIDVAGTDGIILQEDLGDLSLSRWVIDATARNDSAGIDRMLRRAIDLIVGIQAATGVAYSLNSVASRLAFDVDKLSWELNYFFDHYFGSYRQWSSGEPEADAIRRDLIEIATELAERPRTLTHRDYHGMNLMVDSRGGLRIIDHQDARMGPVTYDLVPLLVERLLEPADETWVASYLNYYLQVRSEAGLPEVDAENLRYEFDLMTIQRQLKAIGTFSYQTAVVGRGEVYEKYIDPARRTVLRAISKPGIKEYPALRAALEKI